MSRKYFQWIKLPDGCGRWICVVRVKWSGVVTAGACFSEGGRNKNVEERGRQRRGAERERRFATRGEQERAHNKANCARVHLHTKSACARGVTDRRGPISRRQARTHAHAVHASPKEPMRVSARCHWPTQGHLAVIGVDAYGQTRV